MARIKEYDPSEADDILSDAERAERDVQTCEEEVDDLKGQLKDARERYENAVAELRRNVRRRMESNPLLDGVE